MADFFPLDFTPLTEQEQRTRAETFYRQFRRRRTVRDFSPTMMPPEVLENVIRTAGTAPSGANRQPWRFVVVTDPALKKQIREAAEKEERESYEHRMSDQWLRDLEALGTDWHKEFLEIAPALIVVFSVSFEHEPEGIHKNYYVKESVGIAVGFLLAAIHQAGLVALTHTPSPMDFLSRILERPDNEKPFLLIPVGYPAEGAKVPAITRKSLNEIMLWR